MQQRSRREKSFWLNLNRQAFAFSFSVRPCWRLPDGSGGGSLLKKEAGLVAYVAVLKVVRREDVVERLDWQSTGGMYQTLSVLRREIKKQIDHPLLEQSDTLRLRPDVHCDLQENLADWPTEDLLTRCIFLEGADLPFPMTPWLEVQREQHLARVCSELLRRASELQRTYQLASAIRTARVLTDMAPGNEAGWRTSMWLHYLDENLSAAIEARHAMVASIKRPPSEESEELWRVVAQAKAASSRHARSNPALEKPPRVVGREQPIQAMADTKASSQPFLLRGEGGIGKTRLLRQFLAQQWRKSIVVGCVSGDRDAPYAALARLLRPAG